jgi:SpoVK/Ycf46/Vps4 family AAA+-type ATPase
VKHGTKVGSPIPDTDAPPGVLEALAGKGGAHERAIVVLRDFHQFLDDPLVLSKLKDLIPVFKVTKRMLVVTAPFVKLPPELEKSFAFMESTLPDRTQVGEILDGIIEGTGLTGNKVPNVQRRGELISAAMGLTSDEAENALSLSVVKPSIEKSAEAWDHAIVLHEKCQALRKTGLLDYIPVEKNGLKQIGGLDILKDWVRKRKNAFTPEAIAFGLPTPKGILTVGPPGSGKSLSAKAISGELGFPLLRLDMGKMFGSLVGQSEANMRQAIQIAEANSPCILWLDEVEKGLAGSSAGSLDSGVGARLLGNILTWMQEKTSPVFVYATSNDVTQLPPELLRKGRFDEMFSVTFPNTTERGEIFNIHITRKNRAKLFAEKKLEINQLIERSAGYSGAEIEACINSGLYTAFDAGRELEQTDILNALSETVPVSVTMKEKLARLEEWCKHRTRAASFVESKVVAGGRMVEAN